VVLRIRKTFRFRRAVLNPDGVGVIPSMIPRLPHKRSGLAQCDATHRNVARDLRIMLA
jgi:hypothetical protein